MIASVKRRDGYRGWSIARHTHARHVHRAARRGQRLEPERAIAVNLNRPARRMRNSEASAHIGGITVSLVLPPEYVRAARTDRCLRPPPRCLGPGERRQNEDHHDGEDVSV